MVGETDAVIIVKRLMRLLDSADTRAQYSIVGAVVHLACCEISVRKKLLNRIFGLNFKIFEFLNFFSFLMR